MTREKMIELVWLLKTFAKERTKQKINDDEIERAIETTMEEVVDHIDRLENRD